MNRLSRRRFLAISAAAGLTGSAGAAPQPRVTWRGVALGAEVSITLDGPPEVTRPALARARHEIEAYEARFSLFRPVSDLSRLNAAGNLPDLDARWQAMLNLCDRLHRATGGRFDPTIQPLWLAHATGGDIRAAEALVGWDRVVLPVAGRRGLHLGAGQALSLNGIAQGAASDAVRQVLRDAGLTRLCVDIGETATAGGPWRMGVLDPEQGRFGRVTLRDAALAVSSPGALSVAPGICHILNPRGAAGPLWSSVAVVADDAALADGLSTAACLMAADEIAAAAARLNGVREVLLLNGDGRVERIRTA
ncbi:FAD:protein FMN transferase [Paracoccus sp. NSM]|uniref:FAD:protein FMN transferase n=1 Tax=Paracoccus sp. NSM TaxID=3457784 RepID=UPI004036CAC3